MHVTTSIDRAKIVLTIKQRSWAVRFQLLLQNNKNPVSSKIPILNNQISKKLKVQDEWWFNKFKIISNQNHKFLLRRKNTVQPKTCFKPLFITLPHKLADERCKRITDADNRTKKLSYLQAIFCLMMNKTKSSKRKSQQLKYLNRILPRFMILFTRNSSKILHKIPNLQFP